MAIKINGQDLLKRFINGQEIVRVYKNGGQIRPETVPPTPPFIPDGFHFGAWREWSSILSSMVNIGALKNPSGAGADCIGAINYLKIPPVGNIDSSTGNMTGVGGGATLCTPESSVRWEAGSYWIRARTVSLPINGGYGIIIRGSTANGYSIRLISDTVVQPDASWTTLFTSTTSSSGGIYWNQQLGLITIIYGDTLYTISDKNMGATIVYDYDNMGTTNIDANCVGNLYQWGNCHGFSYSGGYEKSSQLVDVSGLGKYEYSSDVFITNKDYPAHRQPINNYNSNLW